VFSEPLKFTRAQWLEVAREYMGVDKDDKEKMRELSRQRFGRERGTIGSEFRSFAYEVVPSSRLKELSGGDAADPAVKGALRLWSIPWKLPGPPNPQLEERQRVAGYLGLRRVAARFLTDHTRQIQFPNRGVSYTRPDDVGTEALREKLLSEKPLLALGLVAKHAKTDEARVLEALAAASERARRTWPEFLEARATEQRRGQFEQGVYHGFRVAVHKPGGLASELIWLDPVTCSNKEFRANGKTYARADIADWMFFDSMRKDARGGFVLEALLDITHRITTELE